MFASTAGVLGAEPGDPTLLVLVVRMVGSLAEVGGRLALADGGAVAVVRHLCLAGRRRIAGALPAIVLGEAVRPLRGLAGFFRAALATQGRLQRDAQSRGSAPAVGDEVIEAAEQPLGAASLSSQALRPALRGNLFSQPCGRRSRYGPALARALQNPLPRPANQNSSGPKGL